MASWFSRMLASEQKTIEVPAAEDSDYRGRTVKVMYDKSQVVIVWLCGATYTWDDKETLRLALQALDAVGRVPDLVFTDTDTKAYRYYTRLVDGNLQGNDTATLSARMAVPWDKLREALGIAADLKPAPKKAARKRKPAAK